MTTDTQSDFLVPDSAFFVELGLALAAFVIFVVYPILGAVARRQPGWVVASLLLPPFGGLMWWIMARPAHRWAR